MASEKKPKNSRKALLWLLPIPLVVAIPATILVYNDYNNSKKVEKTEKEVAKPNKQINK